MNSTIHDLYFSELNYKYIYDLLSKIIKTETQIDISNNLIYLDIYKKKYPHYFNNNDTDDISFLNKILIDDVGKIILTEIKNNNEKKNTIFYDIVKYKSIMIDNVQHICVQLVDNHNINKDQYINFYNDNIFLNTLLCVKTINNFLFFKSSSFNSNSNKLCV